MEVRIRLQKAGKSTKGQYHYRIVAISKSRGRQGRHLEILGFYDPAKRPALIHIEQEKMDKWIKTGAVLSETVQSLVKKEKAKTK